MAQLDYLNPDLPIDKRIETLLSQMTLEEKATQILNISTKIERLKIPRYDWRNECIHGVGFAGKATVFPQSIGMAASWNPSLLFKVANAISTEARAKYHESIRNNKRKRYYGLTFAAPNINICRDPRWGRCQETYGEDPYLASQLAISFIRGLQGSDPRYLKCVSEVKHYAVHSGPENIRHEIDIKVDQKDLWETYLPAFEASIKEGKAFGIMSAYNRLNGEACSSNEYLLGEILRDTWNFQGYVISDGGAITDIYQGHKLVETYEEAIYRSIKAGCDIINPRDIITNWKIKKHQKVVLNALEQDLLTESDLDISLRRLFKMRFKLGMFDPPEMVPYSIIPFSSVGCQEHRKIAKQMGEESIVLLKNEKNLLPLSKNLGSIAVIGPNANSLDVLLGDYNGEPTQYSTILHGIKSKVSQNTKVFYAKGSELTGNLAEDFDDSLDIAEKAEVSILALGLSGNIEGEEGFVLGPLKGDRDSLDLPEHQAKLLKQIISIGKPMILIISGGSALSINYANEYVPSIIETWYPGQEGGDAIASIIFGEQNPSGKLPLTFYKSVEQLPDFKNYKMIGRTYRFFDGNVIYPFGFGLSYSKFEFSNCQMSSKTLRKNENLIISAQVKNIGPYDGAEVVQLYVTVVDSFEKAPIRELKRFEKVFIKKGAVKTVSFRLGYKDFIRVNSSGEREIITGKYVVSIGGSQPCEKSPAKTIKKILELN